MAADSASGAQASSSIFDTSSTIPLWLDGEEVRLSSTFEVVSPLDQKTLYKCSSANENDVQKAIEAASRAFKTWSQTKPDFRRDIFLRAADEFKRRADELRHYSRSETGAATSMFAIEHNLAYEACKSVAGLIQVASTSTSPIVAQEGSSALLIKEPYGVILGIGPWNAPYVLGLRACLQPLAM